MRLLLAVKESLLSFVHLFIPRYCAVCGKILADGEHLVCTSCRWNMPLTYSWKEEDNPVWRKLNGIIPVYRAASFYYYQKRSGYDQLIYDLKYRGHSSLCYVMGKWFGEELKRSGYYDDIDLIVPVPLHPFRLMTRGYNQSEYFARGISAVLNVPVSRNNLVRKAYNRSQTHHSRLERWRNVEGIFDLRFPARFTSRHLLLVDDVLTTGATIESCVAAIRAKVGECRISVATLATSSKDVF